MASYLSGIQPSGRLHIGNYFGCIKPFLSINQKKSDNVVKNIFLIADMHCYTKIRKGVDVCNQVNEVARGLLAAGLNPNDTLIVQQSKVNLH